MNDRQLDFRIREIKRTYKRYTGERTDGVASIADVARWFSIMLDGNRLDDYYVETIDFKKPAIVIVDDAMKTAYRAEYTSNAEMFHSSGGNVKYISVKSYNALRTTESLYYIFRNDEEFLPIATKITIKDGNMELIFMKERSHQVGFPGNVGNKFTIGYDRILQNEEDKSDTRKQPLLTKVHKSFFDNGVLRRLDYMFTYSAYNRFDVNDEQDRFAFVDETGVEYVVNEFILKDEEGRSDTWIDGFCFENLLTSRKRKLPLPDSMDLLNKENAPELYSPKTKSAIRFRGCAARHMWCDLEVYKSNDGLHVKYRAIKDGEGREVENSDDFILSVLAPGSISIEEIDSLIEAINSKYSDDEFIRQATIQLREFRCKICINKGLTIEEEDALSPKTFLAMPIEEVENLVVENREAYFDLAREQFENSTHLEDIDPDDIKSFRMTPKKD